MNYLDSNVSSASISIFFFLVMSITNYLVWCVHKVSSMLVVAVAHD